MKRSEHKTFNLLFSRLSGCLFCTSVSSNNSIKNTTKQIMKSQNMISTYTACLFLHFGIDSNTVTIVLHYTFKKMILYTFTISLTLSFLKSIIIRGKRIANQINYSMYMSWTVNIIIVFIYLIFRFYEWDTCLNL